MGFCLLVIKITASLTNIGWEDGAIIIKEDYLVEHNVTSEGKHLTEFSGNRNCLHAEVKQKPVHVEITSHDQYLENVTTIKAKITEGKFPDINNAIDDKK
ncbi:hypothetical protein DINM_001181 [Dirofilaria immitis]|nr:hypothetical protein [Dirofilaria immitis]